MSHFYINERRDRDLTILDMKGSLGIGSSNLLFENKMRHLFENGQNQIILNLSSVSKIDVAGFGALFEGHQKVSEAGGQFKICSLNNKVLELLTITKLITYFDVFETEKKATESFQIRINHNSGRHIYGDVMSKKRIP